MHTVDFFSIEGARLLTLFVFLLQVQHGSVYGGAAVELSTKPDVEVGLARGDRRGTVDQHAMPSLSATRENESNPTSATLAAQHHMAKASSASSFHVDVQEISHPRAQVMARMSSASEVLEMHSKGNLSQALSGHRPFARDSMAQLGDSRVMRSESSRRGTGVARVSMTQHTDSKVQGLMRSEKSKRGRGAPKHKIALSHQQGFNDGHMPFLPTEKARSTTAFGSDPSGSTGKQTFIVDQSGHAAPELEIAPRRDGHISDKGVARDSTAMRKDSKVLSLMRSENSKRDKGVLKRNMIVSPMQVLNDGRMPALPAERARATRAFGSDPADSFGKQTFIVDQSGDAAPDLEMAPRRDQHALSKAQIAFAEQKAFASDDVDAERVRALVAQQPATETATEHSGGQFSLLTVIIIVLLLLAILLLLDMSLNGRIREQQEMASASRRLRVPSAPSEKYLRPSLSS